MKNIRWIAPFLIVLCLFALYATWMGIWPNLPESLQERGAFGDSFGVLNSLFSGLGFAAVVVTIWIQQGQIKSQEQERIDEVAERRSLFNLNAALAAIEQARNLLSDNNNNRRTWIEAARLLGHVQVLADGITIDCHKRVFEINQLKYRAFFSDLLKHKTAAFFYGVDEGMAIDDAARASNAPADPRSTSETRWLEGASIYKVWEAAQWPSDFEETVGQSFSQEEKDSLIFDARGLRDYLQHKEQFKSIGGILRPRTRQAS